MRLLTSSAKTTSRDQIKIWNNAVRVQHVVIESKSKHLRATQKLFVVAVSAVALLLVLLIFSRGGVHKAVPQDSFRLLPIVEKSYGSMH